MNQLRYCLLTAMLDCGISEHPERQMRKLGYKILDAVPQSIGDQWWFTVEEYNEPLPPYLEKMEYDIDEYR